MTTPFPRWLWNQISQRVWPNGNGPDNARRLPAPRNGRNANEFIIVGLGRFGTSLAMTLNAYRHDVLAVDKDIARVQEVAQILPHAHVIQLDTTNIDALREVGAEAFDTAVVCIGTDFEANILATVNLRKLGVRRVIAKARTVTQKDILMRVGAEEVILPEHEAGVRLARRLSAINFVDFLELGQDKGVVELTTPSELVGCSLRDAEIRQKYGLAVIAIRREDDVIISPRAEEVLHQDDILVVLGRIANCEKFKMKTH